MRATFRRSLCALAALAALAGVAPLPAVAQQTFDLAWTSSVRVSAGGRTDPDVDHDGTRRGRATLTLVASPLPGVAFAFDFRGPDGAGTGLVLADGRTIDDNFAFPTEPVPEPTPSGLHRIRSRFRLLGTVQQPRGVELEFTEVFVCRAAPEACRGVKRWERSFTATGRPVTGGSPSR